MIELADNVPEVDVQPAEYKRLLGYPRDGEMTDGAIKLAQWARDWYARHGRPWIYAREAEQLEVAHGSVRVEGVPFSSESLQSTLEQARAHGAVLVAVSAGPEIEQAAQIAWQEGKPDESFFLEVFGSAVVEHLVTMVGARLCTWADEDGTVVLPHRSPGYSDWDVAEQVRLLALIRQKRNCAWPSQLEVLETGMLRPKKSLLAVFGVTRQIGQLQRLTQLVPCERCSFHPCQFRRMPYARRSSHPVAAGETNIAAVPIASATTNAPLDHDADYAVNIRALKRWTAERLKLQRCADGTIDALFRYEGTTCTNMGRPLAFRYHVKLGPRHQRFPILEQRCSPVPNDLGYTHMCGYVRDTDGMMAAIEADRPLLGKSLNDVLLWNPSISAAGCYCETADRLHKWRLVLETIHYSLVELEKRRG